jgi:hypothetical protein
MDEGRMISVGDDSAYQGFYFNCFTAQVAIFNGVTELFIFGKKKETDF